MTQDICTVAVVGCGVIGMGWTALFLSKGLRVIVSDPADGAEQFLKQYLDHAKPFFEEHGVSEQLTSNYEFVRDIVPRLTEVDFVQEVIVPASSLKR
jgi:3-hydroxyacyl-CoA dehydrogenase